MHLCQIAAERLQLAELKELIHHEDPVAFIAIQNLHEGCQRKARERSRHEGQTRIEQVIGTNLQDDRPRLNDPDLRR